MRFAHAARLHENIILGVSKNQVFSDVDSFKDAMELYQLFIPSKPLLNKTTLVNRFAEEVGTYIDVVMDVLGERKVWKALAGESNEGSPRNRSVSEMIMYAESVAEGAISILDAAHTMDEVEAKLFWRFIMGEKVMTETAFLLSVSGNKISPQVLNRHIKRKPTYELLEVLFTDPLSLDAGELWYQDIDLALVPRRFFPHISTEGQNKIINYNGGFYQRVLDKGSTKMLHIINEPTGSRFVWRDRSGRLIPRGIAPKLSWSINGPVILETVPVNDTLHVYDAIYPRYAHLKLDERLKRFQESLTDEPIIVHHPVLIDHWGSLAHDDDMIRFPNNNPYNPTEEGGYTLMKSLARKPFRIHSVKKNEDSISIKVCALDGIDDFVVVGEMETFGDLTGQLAFTINRRTGMVLHNQWQEVPSEQCIVVEVVTPTIIKNPLVIVDPLLVAVRDDLGMNDVLQVVDIMFGEDDG